MNRRRERRAPAMRRWIAPITLGATTIAATELASRLGLVREVVLPAPSTIVAAWRGLAGEEFYWSAVWATMSATLIGFALGVSVGLLLGWLFASSQVLSRAFLPLVVAFENTPRVALAPLFVTWLGFGLAAKVVLAAAICFFPLVLNTMAAFSRLDRDRAAIMRSLGASRLQTLLRFQLPEVSPVLFNALKTAITLALIGAIVAEFVAGSEGVATLINDYTRQILVPEVFAIILTLGLLGLLLYGAVVAAEARALAWTRIGSAADSSAPARQRAPLANQTPASS